MNQQKETRDRDHIKQWTSTFPRATEIIPIFKSKQIGWYDDYIILQYKSIIKFPEVMK